MKSAGFHVKSKDHLQGIVTLCFQRFQKFFLKKKSFLSQTIQEGRNGSMFCHIKNVLCFDTNNNKT